MKKHFMLTLLALTAATGVSATENEGQQPAKKEKMICKSEKVTGSRTKVRRTCMTQAQWDQLAESTKKGLDEMGRNAAGGLKSSFDPSKMGGG